MFWWVSTITCIPPFNAELETSVHAMGSRQQQYSHWLTVQNDLFVHYEILLHHTSKFRLPTEPNCWKLSSVAFRLNRLPKFIYKHETQYEQLFALGWSNINWMILSVWQNLFHLHSSQQNQLLKRQAYRRKYSPWPTSKQLPCLSATLWSPQWKLINKDHK